MEGGHVNLKMNCKIPYKQSSFYISVSFHLQTIKEHGGFDILVSNAAANPYFGSILEVSV